MNKYRVSVATAALGVITLSSGQSLGKNSFSSSIFASALAKFHGVKASSSSKAVVVATAATVGSPSKQQIAPAVAPVIVAKAVIVTPVVKAPPVEVSKRTAYVAKAEPVSHDLTQEEVDRLNYNLGVISGGPLADPNSVSVEMPEPAEPAIDVSDMQKGTRNLQLKWVNEGYFDAGYEKLIGTFTTQMLRYGVRYGDDDLHAYVRNETLDTRGTGLPYPQAVTGLSAGLEARHWFPGNKMYIVGSVGEGISGLNSGQIDVRYGAAGYTSWRNGRWFGDFYGELFYIALAADTFLDWRLRSGQIIKTYKDGSYLWDYLVGQFWISGQVESPTENRAEFGPGIGYMFRGAISVNLEMRAGYAYRSGGIDASNERLYWNPTFIIAGGWYKGWP